MMNIIVKIPSYAQQMCELGNRQINTVSIDVPAYSRSGTLFIWENYGGPQSQGY